MFESLEQAENELEQSERQIEQIEDEMEEINTALEEIEQTLERLEGKGDQEVAESVRHNLTERQQEKVAKEEEARQVMAELDQVREQILEVDQWNNEAHQEIGNLQQLGENVGDAATRIADRERAVEAMEDRYKDGKNRLNQIIQSSGYA